MTLLTIEERRTMMIYMSSEIDKIKKIRIQGNKTGSVVPKLK